MDNGKKNASRVLTTKEIREAARNWSLAGDVGLLAHLEQFSENVISKTQETQKHLSELVDNYEELYTKVGNITNQFLALQNCQFVENRVYDEETPTEEKAVVKVQNEVEQEKLLLMQYKEAVEVGIRLLDTHFEEVQLPPNSDSDDDDEASAGNSVIWKPKNPYAGKKFPLLIGSAEWWADDHVGLGGAEEDVLDTEKVISESDSDMEPSKGADRGSDKDMKSSSSSSVENIKSAATKPPFPDSSSEDLFGLERDENIKSSASDDFFFKRAAFQHQQEFLSELEKGGHSPDASQPEPSQTQDGQKVDNAFTRELMAKLSSVTSRQGPQEEKGGSAERLAGEKLFDETDDSSGLFAAKAGREEAPAGGKGLFFEAEVEDELFKGEKDLFSGGGLFESEGVKKAEAAGPPGNAVEPAEEPQKAAAGESAQPKKTSVNDLFNDWDDEDTLFATKSVDRRVPAAENGPQKKAKSLAASDLGWDDDGLFENSATDDDFFSSSGLFSASRTTEPEASVGSSSGKTSLDLFPEEPHGGRKSENAEELVKSEVFESAVGVKKPLAKEFCDDPFGLSPPKESGAKRVNILESEDDDEDDLFSKGSREERRAALRVSAFPDDEDTALFAEKPKPPDSLSVSSSRSSLFDDVSASKSRLASVFEKDKRAEEELFSVAEDSLFGGGGGAGGRERERGRERGKEKRSLFEDCEDDEDLFGGEKASGGQVKRSGSVLEGGRKEGWKEGGGAKGLGEESGDEELFRTSTRLRETKSDILRQSEQKLFADELDDAELFSSQSGAAKAKPPSSLSLKGSESEARGKTVGRLNIPDNLKLRFESVAKHIGGGGGRPSAEERREEGREERREEGREEEQRDELLDEAPQPSNLLKCPSKDRVKIPGRRRPQSRRARQEAIRNSGVWDQPASPRSDLGTPHPSKDSLSSPAASNPLSPSTDEEDFFKVPELDTTLEREDQSIFKSDLFESAKSCKADEGLLFDGAPVLSPLGSRKERKAGGGSLFDDEELNGEEDEDLFGTPKASGGQLSAKSEGKAKAKAKGKERAKAKQSLFDQDSDEEEEELFGGKSQCVPANVVLVVKGKEKEKEKQKEKEKEKEKEKGGSGFLDPLGLMSKD